MARKDNADKQPAPIMDKKANGKTQVIFGPTIVVLALCGASAASPLAGSPDASSSQPSARSPVAQPSLAASASWDKAAARYLDDRMDIWFAKAKKLRTGDDNTSCVSCHTTVPYALVRPALRRAAGDTTPTSQEGRLLAETLHRVETYADNEPLYKSKEEQSNGTEAVLNLLLLVGADTPQNHQALSGPIHKALDEFWSTQRADGAWEWLDFGNEPYESTDSVYYGAAIAALAVGLAGNYKAAESNPAGLDKLRSYLKGNYPAQNIYNKTWLLLASARLPGLLNGTDVQALARDLQRRQNADGGWSLYKLGPWTWSKATAPYTPEGKPDLSLLSNSDAYATGLIVYALREAGVPSIPMVTRARDWLLSNQGQWQIDQHHWSCWRSYSLNQEREQDGDEGEPWRRMFMSDAATAFAALALLPPNSSALYK